MSQDVHTNTKGESAKSEIFKFYQHQPGHPDIKKCMDEAMELYRIIRPIVWKNEDITAAVKLQNIKRKFRANRKFLRNAIINRRRYNSGNHALRPLIVMWSMLNACNYKCTYCDNHQGEIYPNVPDPDRLKTEDGKKLLDIIYTGTSAMAWCGGEPTLRNDLPELLDYAWDIGFYPNYINTNGAIIHKRLQKENWKKFLYQMDLIVVSLDGLNLDLLNNLWATKKARQTIVNLLLLRELNKDVNFRLAINVVITPNTIKEANTVIDFANDLGIWVAPVAMNEGHLPNSELLKNKDYKSLVNKILTRKKQGYKFIGAYEMLKNCLTAQPFNCVTALKPHVWSNGHVAWPCRAAVNVNPVDINVLNYNTWDEMMEAGRSLINPDYFHGQKSNQCGGDCSWMHNYATDHYIKAITKPVKNRIIANNLDFFNWSK